MKLFMFYIGGDCGNSNIELHDIRFSVGKSPEACYDDLRRQWWGTPKSLHLDCWGAIEQADGYDVTVVTTPPPKRLERLFFLNLGGYDGTEFGELHKNLLIVAPDAKTAAARALKDIRGWSLKHRDSAFEVEKTIDLDMQASRQACFLDLSPALTKRRFGFVCRYVRLG